MDATTQDGTQAAEAVRLGIETLRGDIRDRFLDNVVRQLPCWTKMSENEQRVVIGRVEEVARQTVRESIQIVAHQGFAHLVVSTGKWTVKDGLKLEVGAAGSVDDITKLAEHGTKSAVLVLAEPSVFFGQRADALVDKDEPELPILDEDGVISDEAGESEGVEQQDDGAADEEVEEQPDTSALPEPPAGRAGRRGRVAAHADA